MLVRGAAPPDEVQGCAPPERVSPCWFDHLHCCLLPPNQRGTLIHYVFVKHDAPAAKHVAGDVLVDEPGMAVTGVSNGGAFPGLVIEFVAVVRVDVHVAGASKDTELGQVRFLVGDGTVGDTGIQLLPLFHTRLRM